MPFVVVGNSGICRHTSIRRYPQQADQREVPPHWLEERSDSDWDAVENFWLNPFFVLWIMYYQNVATASLYLFHSRFRNISVIWFIIRWQVLCWKNLIPFSFFFFEIEEFFYYEIWVGNLAHIYLCLKSLSHADAEVRFINDTFFIHPLKWHLIH